MQPILFTNNDKHIERLRIAIHGHAKTIAWFLFGAWIAITIFFETDVSTAWSPGDECLVN